MRMGAFYAIALGFPAIQAPFSAITHGFSAVRTLFSAIATTLRETKNQLLHEMFSTVAGLLIILFNKKLFDLV